MTDSSATRATGATGALLTVGPGFSTGHETGMNGRVRAVPGLHDARVLIVDDHRANVRLLESILQRAGYRQLRSTLNPFEVSELYHAFQPDIVLLDLHMPRLDGFSVLEGLQRELPPETYLPVLVLTADATVQAKRRALAIGAKDFVKKPFDSAEVLLRVRNLLETRLLYKRLDTHNHKLEEGVRQRTADLEHAQVEIVERLALAAEYRDDDTGQHTYRVGRMAGLLARELGMEEAATELIQRASPLHDMGKIGIPDHILHKPSRLDAAEFEQMKTHTTIGAQIARGSASPLLQLAGEIARTHHERWDGGGYPEGLAGEAIPLVGRIVAVVDVFDALTNARPYKPAWPVAEATAEILRQSGQQFDPRVVQAFLAMLEAPADLSEESAPVGDSEAGEPASVPVPVPLLAQAGGGRPPAWVTE
jgi:putative two-component system response regulator